MQISLPTAFRHLLATALLTSSLQAEVTILDAPQLGLFESLPAAIQAAPPGSTLMVSSGDYAGFVLDKELNLITPAEVGARILGPITIEGLQVGEAVRLQGFTINATVPDQTFPGIFIRQCGGTVRLDSCTIRGGAGSGDEFFLDAGGDAVLVEDSSDVALLQCTLRGGVGAGEANMFCCTGGTGGSGLRSRQSQVAVYDSMITGGRGGLAGFLGGEGGPGARITGGTLFAANSSFRGGAGGDADDFIVLSGGDGGTGLSMGAQAIPRLLGNTYAGGAGGTSIQDNGAPGAATFWGGGSLTELSGAARSMTIDQPFVAAGSSWLLEIDAQPGDRVFVALSQAGDFLPANGLGGTWLVPFPARMLVMPLGTVPASGQLSVQLAALPLQDGSPLDLWTGQLFVRDLTGLAALGSARSLGVTSADTPVDCDTNGLWDVLDILQQVPDCDGNFVLDACQLLPDCNANGIADDIETECLGVEDKNGNSIPDACEEGGVSYVDPQAMAGGDGSSSAPFRTLAEAFDAAVLEWRIVLRDGIYTGPGNNEVFSLDNRLLTIESENGPLNCIIEGPGSFSEAGFSEGTWTLRGITFENRQAVHARFTEVHVEDCRFRSCFSSGDGGALQIGRNSTVHDSEFVSNQSFGNGGAISSLTPFYMTGCTFDLNEADNGGAVSLRSFAGTPSEARISHSIFRANSASERGGGLHLDFVNLIVDVRLDHLFFALNEASLAGGGAYLRRANLSLDSSTFVRNTGGRSQTDDAGGGGLFLDQWADVTLRNSLLWDNEATLGPQARVASSSPTLLAELDANFSNVQGGAAQLNELNGTASFGNGMIDADPLFVNETVGDYRLGAGSPCIDAGIAAQLPRDFFDLDGDGDTLEPVPFDLLGQPRPVDDPGAPDTGQGAAPMTDMGALERQP